MISPSVDIALAMATERSSLVFRDVNLTRDGQLAMIHDWTLDRTTNGSGPVRTLTLDEVQRLDAGSWFRREFSGLRVPTTAETVELPTRPASSCASR